jgi:hypothetical protein
MGRVPGRRVGLPPFGAATDPRVVTVAHAAAASADWKHLRLALPLLNEAAGTTIADLPT